MGRAVVAGLVVAGAVFAAVMLAGGEHERPIAAEAPAPTGQTVFAEMGCGSCHRLAAASSTGQIGPDLDERLRAHTRASLRQKIVDPASSQRYTTMPEDFDERMSDAELDALVDFLLAARTQGN